MKSRNANCGPRELEFITSGLPQWFNGFHLARAESDKPATAYLRYYFSFPITAFGIKM
jgi:hypothetical protein